MTDPSLADTEAASAESTLSQDQVLALWEIARLANEGLELRPMMQRITDRLAQRFGWELVALVKIIAEENRFECQAVTSSRPTEVRPGYSRELGSGVVGQVAASGEPILLDDIRDFPGFVETLDQTASEICVPVRHQGKVVAVLNAESTRPAHFKDQKLLFEAVAEQISSAVARGLLFEVSRARADLLETLAEVSRRILDGRDLHERLQDLMEYLRERFQLVIAGMLISDEQEDYWQDQAISIDPPVPEFANRQWPIDAGIVGRAVRNGRTELVPQVDSDPDFVRISPDVGAELVIPLRFRGRTVGALNLEARQVDDFSPSRVEAFEAIAAQISGAVELAVSHRRLRKSEKDLGIAIEELRIANQTLNQMTLVDSLTGLGNRRQLDRRLADEWNRARRQKEPLSLALLDVDFFKAFNDAYGHPAGDECLQRVATSLADSIERAGELVARYGGEEFVLVLPRMSAEDAECTVERARCAVGELRIPHCQSEIAKHLTVSAGVATRIPDDDSTVKELLASADRALYRAKAGGRNRTEVERT